MKRLIIFLLLMFGMIAGVSAVLTDNNEAYWSLDNTLLDLTGNSHTLTNNGATYTASGKINGAYTFVTNDYMENNFGATPNYISINMWINRDSLITNYQTLFNKHQNGAVGTYGAVLGFDLNQYLTFSSSTTGSDFNTITSTTAISDLINWHMVTITYDGTNAKIYIDGTLDKTTAISGTLFATTWPISIGSRKYATGNDRFFDGSIDEVSIWSRALTSTEVTELYNSNSGLQYPFQSTPTINSDVQDFYNTENITINLNTTTNSNYSYVLDGGSEISIINDTNSTTLQLFNLSEILHNITFISTDSNGQVNTTENFTNDYTDPNLTKIGNVSENSFILNGTEIISFNDSGSGIASCLINITELENVTTPDNFLINCTDIQTFITAGLHNAFVTATDNAGNIETLSFNFSIVPFVYIFFQDANNTIVTNYTATIYHPDNRTTTPTINNDSSITLSPVNNGVLDLGTHTIQFEKLGFQTQNSTIVINETSNFNINISVPGAKILISIYDITDYSLISTNTTIEIIGNSFSQIYTATNGVLNISDLAMEDEIYSIIVSNADYETSTTSFNFNNQEVIEVAAYLTPLVVNDTLIADIIISVVDDYQSPLKKLSVLQYVWDSTQSQYVQSNLKTTDKDGQTSFKVFLNTKRYTFCAEYLGVLYCEADLFININTQEVVIEIPISEINLFDEDSINDITFPYSLINTTIDIAGTNYTSITFTYSNSNQDVDNYCLNIYEINNLKRTLISNKCSTSHTSALSINVIENRSKNYVAVATIESNSDVRELDPPLFLYASFNIQDELEDYGFIKIILIVLVGVVIGIALSKKVHDVTIAHIFLPIIYLPLPFIFPNYISFESFVLVAIVNYMAFKIITKKDDINKEANFNTLTSILILYMIFIFSLFTALTEMDNKGYLDDYGQVILDNIVADNSYFDTFIDTSSTQLKDKRADAKIGAWDLLTGIFLKTLEFIDMFFSILSNLFSIATTMALIMGIKNDLLLKLIKAIDYTIVVSVLYLYFKEAFK